MTLSFTIYTHSRNNNQRAGSKKTQYSEHIALNTVAL